MWGQALHGTAFMGHVERMIPDGSLPRASRLLHNYGFWAMFSSRFVPFVRVLTPMLMGVSRLHLPRVMIASFASAFLWALVLSLVGKAVMAAPVFAQYHELLTAPAGDPSVCSSSPWPPSPSGCSSARPTAFADRPGHGPRRLLLSFFMAPPPLAGRRPFTLQAGTLCHPMTP